MKKIIIIILAICLSNSLFSQDSILVTPTGITNSKLTSSIDNKMAYQRTIEWVNENFKNPDKVITGKVDGKSVTIAGVCSWNNTNTGNKQYFDMEFNLYITLDTVISFNFIEGKHYSSGKIMNFKTPMFFKSNGEYRNFYNTGKSTLEESLNSLWFSYHKKIMNSEMSSDEALTELKRFKDKLDLGLITQEEFDKKKTELAKFIK